MAEPQLRTVQISATFPAYFASLVQGSGSRWFRLMQKYNRWWWVVDSGNQVAGQDRIMSEHLWDPFANVFSSGQRGIHWSTTSHTSFVGAALRGEPCLALISFMHFMMLRSLTGAHYILSLKQVTVQHERIARWILLQTDLKALYDLASPDWTYSGFLLDFDNVLDYSYIFVKVCTVLMPFRISQCKLLRRRCLLLYASWSCWLESWGPQVTRLPHVTGVSLTWDLDVLGSLYRLTKPDIWKDVHPLCTVHGCMILQGEQV